MIPLAVFLCCILLLGAVISAKPFVNRYLCVGCGDCVKHCPTGSVTLVYERALIDQSTCIDCGFCVKSCNYNAIRRPK